MTFTKGLLWFVAFNSACLNIKIFSVLYEILADTPLEASREGGGSRPLPLGDGGHFSIVAISLGTVVVSSPKIIINFPIHE